jgi:periplasmic copper chaperone A
MKTQHITILSIAACAIIVPLMIFVALSSPKNTLKNSTSKTPSEGNRIKGDNAIAALNKSTLPTITNARVRTTVPGARVSAAYMDIAATQALTLVSAEAKIAGLAEIHSMAMRDGVMEMRALEQLPIPANVPLKLERGGMHLMLLQLNAQINAGDKVPLVLTFKGADGKAFKINVEALAETFGAASSPTPEHKH